VPGLGGSRANPRPPASKATFLVKKIFHKSHVPGSAVEQTTTYRPRLNVEIAPEAFTFVPHGEFC
jgi:hypothetical protein